MRGISGKKAAPAKAPAKVARPKPKLDPVKVIFDAEFYLATYPDVADTGLTPLEHYRTIGRAELRQPSPLFDPVWYLERNADVARNKVEPLVHFLRNGGKEGRDPIPFGFDSRWYRAEHPEIGAANPLVHYLAKGAALGYQPSPYFDSAWYKSEYLGESTENPLVHYLRLGREQGLRPSKRGVAEGGLELLMAQRFEILQPLRTIPGENVPRLNLVTDAIGPDTLFGGVATALVLAILWAERSGRRLRIVTRYPSPDTSGLAALYASIGIEAAEEPELATISCIPGDYLEVGDGDIFLTTSWWTTSATLKVIPAERVTYILQEDERLFYPIGTWWLWAAQTMNTPGLTVVVNTSNLLQHLVTSGIDNLATTGISFEPSFTSFLQPGRTLAQGEKRQLFFYARPANPRNLFDVGVLALDKAIENGWLPTADWDVHFVGRHLPEFVFCDETAPIHHTNLDWAQYHDLLGTIDLGLSLMSSPHPSYPPLDLAASGSVVVTNSWPGKPDLATVSKRLIVAEPTADALAEAIRDAVAQVEAVREEPFVPNPTPYFNSWRQNFAPVLDHLDERFGRV